MVPSGTTRASSGTLFGAQLILWTVFQPHPQNHSPMGIFSRIRRRANTKNEKKTCAHKFLFETTKNIQREQNTEKRTSLKLIFLPINFSRSCYYCIVSTIVFPILAVPAYKSGGLYPRGWMPHPKKPERVPREIGLFLPTKKQYTSIPQSHTHKLISQSRTFTGGTLRDDPRPWQA